MTGTLKLTLTLTPYLLTLTLALTSLSWQNSKKKSSGNLGKIIRKIDQRHWTTDQQWSKHLPKNNQTSIKNRPKMDLEAVLGRFAKLYRRWGASWRVWEAFWEGPGRFLGSLEAKLRAKMVPSWIPRGRFWGFKNEAKMDALSGAS